MLPNGDVDFAGILVERFASTHRQSYGGGKSRRRTQDAFGYQSGRNFSREILTKRLSNFFFLKRARSRVSSPKKFIESQLLCFPDDV